MPVTPAATFEWVIADVQIDMVNVQCGVSLIGQLVAGTTVTPMPNARKDFTIPTADFTTLITAMPTAGLTRQNDLTAAIYNYAVAQGYVTGAVS
ncbi:MAG: hypothetical protein KGL39_23710 [Patescibacteria group bacterium]|nr:hypothetical protein [Patescibacteria group bacterium]